MTNIISIIVVAVLGVVGNIIYFEYQSHKKSSKEIQKEKLTKLLLPLYKVLCLEEIKSDAWTHTDDGNPVEVLSDLPNRVLKPIEKIINKYIYLANDDLHKACVDFLIWANNNDSDDRYQKIMKGNFQIEVDKEFKKFYDIVTSEYNKSRLEYLKK